MTMRKEPPPDGNNNSPSLFRKIHQGIKKEIKNSVRSARTLLRTPSTETIPLIPDEKDEPLGTLIEMENFLPPDEIEEILPDSPPHQSAPRPIPSSTRTIKYSFEKAKSSMEKKPPADTISSKSSSFSSKEGHTLSYQQELTLWFGETNDSSEECPSFGKQQVTQSPKKYCS